VSMGFAKKHREIETFDKKKRNITKEKNYTIGGHPET